MARRRVALIGAGHAANRYHCPSLTTFPDAELVAVCDLNPERAANTAARFGIQRTYSDYRPLLAEVDPEVVYLAVPPQHLLEPALAVLEQRRHLFTEKPLGVSADQARRLADAASRVDVLTMVGFQRRFIPALTDLRARIEARGPIHTVMVEYLKTARHVDASGGFHGGAVDPLTSDGVHAVDNLRWLCGGDVVRVHKTTDRVEPPGDDAPVGAGTRYPNRYVALVTFSSGAVGILHNSYVTGRRVFRATLHAHNATATVDADAEASIVMDDGPVERRPSKEWDTAGGAPGGSTEHYLGFWHENRHFFDCLREGRQPASHFADALKTMELVEQLATA